MMLRISDEARTKSEHFKKGPNLQDQEIPGAAVRPLIFIQQILSSTVAQRWPARPSHSRK
jgi:hypothetical protein